MPNDYYKILGINRDATHAEIAQSFEKNVKEIIIIFYLGIEN